MITKTNDILQSKFTLLLVSLILFILLSPYISTTLITRFLLLFITLFIFVAVMFAILQERFHLILFMALTFVSFIINCIYVIKHNNLFAGLNALGLILVFLIAIYSFIKDIMHHKVITQDLIIGSICIYLLIGLTYSYVYSLIEIIHPGSFTIMASHQAPNNFEFIYFSFITLTTLGYGDIVSTSIYSKSFVIYESVTGVFYIATLVARLVSAFAKQKSE